MYAEFQLHTLYYFDAERVKREHLIIYQTRAFHKAKRVHPLSCKKVHVFATKSGAILPTPHSPREKLVHNPRNGTCDKTNEHECQ